MFRNAHIRRLWTHGLAALVTLMPASAALAGGFGLAVELPSDRTNPKTTDAVLLVRPGGCHGPGAAVSATAEGLVNGRRQSVPLRLTPMGTDKIGITTYALKRQWPTEGVWILAFTGTSPAPGVRTQRSLAPNSHGYTARCHTILELGPNGSIPAASASREGDRKELAARYVSGEAREIEAALQTLAARQSKTASLSRSVR